MPVSDEALRVDALRGPARWLEVSADEIRLRHENGAGYVIARLDGGALSLSAWGSFRMLRYKSDAGQVAQLPVGGFSGRAIRDACVEAGWAWRSWQPVYRSGLPGMVETGPGSDVVLLRDSRAPKPWRRLLAGALLPVVAMPVVVAAVHYGLVPLLHLGDPDWHPAPFGQAVPVSPLAAVTLMNLIVLYQSAVRRLSVSVDPERIAFQCDRLMTGFVERAAVHTIEFGPYEARLLDASGATVHVFERVNHLDALAAALSAHGWPVPARR